MKTFLIGTAVSAYDTDEGKILLILDNDGISHTGKKSSIMSVIKMRAYGEDVDEFTTIFSRDCNTGISSPITDGNGVKFKLQDVLKMVHVWKATEDEPNYCHVMLMTSEMVWSQD